MWALEWEGEVLVVDAGLMFPQEEMLGVDLVLPDPAWLLDPARRVLGVVLTHGHEDHIGGLPFLLKRVNVPVYATALTLGLARPRLREYRFLREADRREVGIVDCVQRGPLRVECGGVGRSIPEAARLVLASPVRRGAT